MCVFSPPGAPSLCMCVFMEHFHHVKPIWTWMVSSLRTSFSLICYFFPSCLSSWWNCITPTENSNSGGRGGSKQPGLLHLKCLFHLLDCTSSSLCVCHLICSLKALTSKEKKKALCQLRHVGSRTFHSICHPAGLSASCFHLLLNNQTTNMLCCGLLNQVVCSCVVV